MDSQKYKIKAMRIISVIVAFVLYSSQLTLTYAVAPDFTKTPIFFVHGYGLSASSWNTMISSLIDAEYPPEYLEAIQLVPDDGANIPAAED